MAHLTYIVNWLLGTRGRIGRRQWWLGHLVNAVLTGIVAALISTIQGSPLHALVSSNDSLGMAPTIGATLLFFWISVASTVKRFHDRNKSGWWAAIMLVPGLGVIWTFYECGLMQGTPGNNAYGPGQGGAAANTSPDVRRREAELELQIAALRESSAAAQQQTALANARYASDVKAILAAQ